MYMYAYEDISSMLQKYWILRFDLNIGKLEPILRLMNLILDRGFESRRGVRFLRLT
jgi:hypothetical protein